MNEQKQEVKTHYRAAFDSPYLSSADIVEPTTLTVKCVRLEPDQTKKTKDKFNTAYFVEQFLRPGEPLKPMILNATNSKTMKLLAGGTPFIEDWNMIPISVYTDTNVRFGKDTVEGLRISPIKPKVVKPELKMDTPAWVNAIAAYRRDGHFDAVEKRMSVSDASKELIRLACLEPVKENEPA